MLPSGLRFCSEFICSVFCQYPQHFLVNISIVSAESWEKSSHVLLIKSTGVVGPFLNLLWVNHAYNHSSFFGWVLNLFVQNYKSCCYWNAGQWYPPVGLPVLNTAGAAEAKTSPSCQAFLNCNGDVRSSGRRENMFFLLVCGRLMYIVCIHIYI